MLKYSVQTWVIVLKVKVHLKITESVCCSYGDNFELV